MPYYKHQENVNFAGINAMNKFTKDIPVNNMPIKASIDLGSECSLIINKSIVNKLNTKTKFLNNSVHIQTFSDLGLEVYEYVTVSINIDDAKRRVSIVYYK